LFNRKLKVNIMEYVQRAVYGPNHDLSHMMHDKVHLAEAGKTLCGKELGKMWFVTGDTRMVQKEVTCLYCSKFLK
jgi:hypothetical protein